MASRLYVPDQPFLVPNRNSGAGRYPAATNGTTSGNRRRAGVLVTGRQKTTSFTVTGCWLILAGLHPRPAWPGLSRPGPCQAHPAPETRREPPGLDPPLRLQSVPSLRSSSLMMSDRPASGRAASSQPARPWLPDRPNRRNVHCWPRTPTNWLALGAPIAVKCILVYSPHHKSGYMTRKVRSRFAANVRSHVLLVSGGVPAIALAVSNIPPTPSVETEPSRARRVGHPSAEFEASVNHFTGNADAKATTRPLSARIPAP